MTGRIVPEVPFTRRRRQLAFAIANTGPLSLYLNSSEGNSYCRAVEYCQRHRLAMPVPEIPRTAREWLGPDGTIVMPIFFREIPRAAREELGPDWKTVTHVEVTHGDPVWRERYLTACLLRRLRARLCQMNYGCYVFPEARARIVYCPRHLMDESAVGAAARLNEM